MDAAKIDLALKAGMLVVELGLILAPVLYAFAVRDKAAMQKLLAALPDVYDVVLQERRRALAGKGSDPGDPLKRALVIAQQVAGRSLRPAERSLVEAKLRAEHERRAHRPSGMAE